MSTTADKVFRVLDTHFMSGTRWSKEEGSSVMCSCGEKINHDPANKGQAATLFRHHLADRIAEVLSREVTQFPSSTL